MDNHRRKHRKDLLDAVIEAGKRHGVRLEAVHQPHPHGPHWIDAHIRLRYPGGDVMYAAEIKRGIRPAMLGAIQYRMETLGERALLVADYVTPAIADELRRRGFEFIDAAGNAHLNEPPLLIWVKGQRPVGIQTERVTGGRAFQATGLRVLFTLLCKPEMAARPYREIAELTGVAHGTVGWVMPDLPKMGHMGEIAGKRRLLNAKRLLETWVEAYARTLRPKLTLGRYRAETLDWTENFDGAEYNLVMGGEPAARELTKHLRPGTATLYGVKPPKQFLLRHRLREDESGEVEILKRFWNFEGERPGLAPLVLVYADLLAIGDGRCLDAAERIYEQFADRLE